MTKVTEETRRKALVQEEEDLAKAIALSLSGPDDKKARGGKHGGSSAMNATGTGGASSGTTTSLYPNFNTPSPLSQTQSAPQKEPKKVRALYDFEAVEDNELTFKSGEIILLLDDSDANWWKGSNHRGEGLFPATFVSEDLDAKPDILEPNKAVSFNEEVSVVEDANIGGPVEPVRIDESCIDECLSMLENADPTGEMKPDPPELASLEARCRMMAPLIDAELEQIDRRHNTLAEMNVRLMEALQLYNQLMAGGSAPPMPMSMSAMDPSAVMPQASVAAMMPPPHPPHPPHAVQSGLVGPGPPPPTQQPPQAAQPIPGPMGPPPGPPGQAGPPGMMYAPQAMYMQPPPPHQQPQQGNHNNSNCAGVEPPSGISQAAQNGVMPPASQQQSFYASPVHNSPASFAPSSTLPASNLMPAHSGLAQAPAAAPQSPLL